ncbi:MAG TPA: peptidylprolyl isomerase [Rhizomicrobium sp.]|jgi:cyclophilin family peptidyl-prolyl cis-trans isomerase|nr:peptidylprolyl isomerase [Rhizomicrobium sp.]
MRNPFAVILAGAFLFAAMGIARAQTAASPDVLIQTSLGDITVALDHAHAPKTVDNFVRYVSEGHYDGTLVYRVVPGFVIQAGSYDSATNTRPVHDPIPLEAGNGLSNLRGTIAMARESDPNSATAEFFINLADNARLDRLPDDIEGTTGYAVFGHVITGMDVVDKIAAVPLGPGGPMPGAWPDDPVKIEKVTVLAAAPAAVPAAAPAPAP